MVVIQRTRKTQRERSDATMGELLEAARELFAKDGYAATSLDAVCDRAGVSKGALYHHFRNKESLFAAVYSKAQKDLAAVVAEAGRGEPDPWLAVYEGCRRFLEASLDPEIQRITLLDAPSTLGWEVLRDSRGDSKNAMRLAVTNAMRKGRIAERPIEPLVSLLYGAVCETAMTVARADDQEAMLATALDELRRLFEQLGGPAA